jgi:hypothetical protein
MEEGAMVRRMGFATIFAAAALGCATEPRWSKPGAAPGDLKRDQDDCMSRTVSRLDSDLTTDPAERARAQRDYTTCMESRGWVPAE